MRTGDRASALQGDDGDGVFRVPMVVFMLSGVYHSEKMGREALSRRGQQVQAQAGPRLPAPPRPSRRLQHCLNINMSYHILPPWAAWIDLGSRR